MSRSAGCNGAAWQGTRLLPANLQPGGRAELTLGYKPPSGLETKFTLSIPRSYSSLVAWPLLVGFHGWGGSGTWSFDKFHEHAKEAGYIVASPNGFEENVGLGSWNGAGTTASPGPNGPTCHDPNRSFAPYCYDSCRRSGGCADTCWWTTCEDSVAQAVALLDELEARLCLDTRRVYSTGISNGGVFQYELATDPRTAARFAAFLPIIGSPHRGFNLGPRQPPRPFFGIWGAVDTTMPPTAAEAAELPSLSGASDLSTVAYDTAYEGYFYNTARNATSRWAAANGCGGGGGGGGGPTPLAVDMPWATAWYPAARAAGSSCVWWSACAAGVRVVECMHPGGHQTPAWAPAALWSFMRSVPPPYLDDAVPPLPLSPPPPQPPLPRPHPPHPSLLPVLLPCLLVLILGLGGAWWARRLCRASRRLRLGSMMKDDGARSQTAPTQGEEPSAAPGAEDAMFQVELSLVARPKEDATKDAAATKRTAAARAEVSAPEAL